MHLDCFHQEDTDTRENAQKVLSPYPPFLQHAGECVYVQSYLETKEKASAQMAGQGTKRMAMRPNAAG